MSVCSSGGLPFSDSCALVAETSLEYIFLKSYITPITKVPKVNAEKDKNGK
jgi:hypothetical protein